MRASIITDKPCRIVLFNGPYPSFEPVEHRSCRSRHFLPRHITAESDHDDDDDACGRPYRSIVPSCTDHEDDERTAWSVVSREENDERHESKWRQFFSLRHIQQVRHMIVAFLALLGPILGRAPIRYTESIILYIYIYTYRLIDRSMDSDLWISVKTEIEDRLCFCRYARAILISSSLSLSAVGIKCGHWHPWLARLVSPARLSEVQHDRNFPRQHDWLRGSRRNPGRPQEANVDQYYRPILDIYIYIYVVFEAQSRIINVNHNTKNKTHTHRAGPSIDL